MESESSDEESVRDETEAVQARNTELEFVAQFVMKNRIIMTKSKLQEDLKLKERAMKMLQHKYEAIFGKCTDTKTLFKKISNLKAVVKKKTDLSRTGNKQPKFSKAESFMLQALERENGDLENSILHKLKGKCAVSITEEVSSKESGAKVVSRAKPPSPLPVPSKKLKAVLTCHKTEDTRHLTNNELQRLVLLKQLEVLKLKEELLLKKLAAEAVASATTTTSKQPSSATIPT